MSVVHFATSPNSGVKLFRAVSEVRKDNFSLYLFWRCVIFLVFFFLLLRSRDGGGVLCLSQQGILLPRVYGTTTSPLWLELQGPAAWQATPSWTEYRLACQQLLPWLGVTFAMVPDAAWAGSDQQPWGTAPAAAPVGRLGRPSLPHPWAVVCCCPSLVRPRHARVCGLLGDLAPLHRCARSVCCFARVVSWATCPLFTGVPARCVALRVCGVPDHFAALHWCARSVCCVACAVSLATWLLFGGMPARCVVLRARCPGPLSFCSPVCSFDGLFCVCGVLGHLAPVH